MREDVSPLKLCFTVSKLNSEQGVTNIFNQFTVLLILPKLCLDSV